MFVSPFIFKRVFHFSFPLFIKLINDSLKVPQSYLILSFRSSKRVLKPALTVIIGMIIFF